jgi:hypothetical protein
MLGSAICEWCCAAAYQGTPALLPKGQQQHCAGCCLLLHLRL